jgi:hypothetical protein
VPESPVARGRELEVVRLRKPKQRHPRKAE